MDIIIVNNFILNVEEIYIQINDKEIVDFLSRNYYFLFNLG